LPHGHSAIYAQRKRLAQVQSARKTWFFSKNRGASIVPNGIGTAYETPSPLRRSPSSLLSNLAEFAPKPDSSRIVDVEHGGGGSTVSGSPDKDESHPFEAALPVLPAGMEEANDFAGERISPAQVRPLPEITSVTTPDDMFDISVRHPLRTNSLPMRFVQHMTAFPPRQLTGVVRAQRWW
jgi:hypothetical protein